MADKLRFSANLSFLFNEMCAFGDRYLAAKTSGFTAVESMFPTGTSIQELQKRRQEAGVKHVLMNTYPGNEGEYGLAALCGRQEDFRQSLQTTIMYAKALDCDKLHIMAGLKQKTHTVQEMEQTYIENLRHALEQLSKENMTALIEPINQMSVPGYFLSSFDQALKYLKAIDSPNLRLQLDIFHLQMIEGNLTNRIQQLWPYVEHIQVAQAPHRHQPSELGEIDYKYVFNLIKSLGYKGWIGCEYKPKGMTVDSFDWLKRWTTNV